MRAEPTPDRIDVELPLGGPALPVDVDLSSAAARAGGPVATPTWDAFRPTLSQVAAQALSSRVRWPGQCRSGYHGGSAWNWMRDGSAGFGERSVIDR